MIRMLTIAAILALSGAAAQARTTSVIFGDLDMGAPGGAQTLAERIHEAAANVCAIDKPNAGTITLFYQTIEKDCVSYVSKRALTRIQTMVREHRELAQQVPGLIPERQARLAIGR